MTDKTAARVTFEIAEQIWRQHRFGLDAAAIASEFGLTEAEVARVLAREVFPSAHAGAGVR